MSFYFLNLTGGESGIRTHGGVAPSTVFKTVAFNRSAISPFLCSADYYSNFFVKCKDVWKKLFMVSQQRKSSLYYNFRKVLTMHNGHNIITIYNNSKCPIFPPCKGKESFFLLFFAFLRQTDYIYIVLISLYFLCLQILLKDCNEVQPRNPSVKQLNLFLKNDQKSRQECF